MSSFIRFAGAAAVILSLGFLVTALPAATTSVPAITGTDAVSLVCAKVLVDIEVKLRALLACVTLVELEVAIKALISVFQTCADELLKVGAGVAVDVDAKASIAACVAATITLFVQVCAQLSVKFGLAVVVRLCAQVDVVLKLCLANLEICIGGILALIAKAIVSVDVALLVKLNLKLCLKVLGLDISL